MNYVIEVIPKLFPASGAFKLHFLLIMVIDLILFDFSNSNCASISSSDVPSSIRRISLFFTLCVFGNRFGSGFILYLLLP